MQGRLLQQASQIIFVTYCYPKDICIYGTYIQIIWPCLCLSNKTPMFTSKKKRKSVGVFEDIDFYDQGGIKSVKLGEIRDLFHFRCCRCLITNYSLTLKTSCANCVTDDSRETRSGTETSYIRIAKALSGTSVGAW